MFSKVVVLFSLLVVLAQATAEENVPVFASSLQDLYREPPAPPIRSRAVVATEWITQKLDHFDEAETRTWEMVGRNI